MNTASVPRDPLTVANLQRDAEWARDSFEIHWSVCRSRMADRFCQKCEDLDVAAFAAERVYLEAQDAR